jgi:hypothetical protein
MTGASKQEPDHLSRSRRFRINTNNVDASVLNTFRRGKRYLVES